MPPSKIASERVERAEKLVAELERELSAVQQTIDRMTDERGQLALAAREGNGEAASMLEELDEKLPQLRTQAANIEAAMPAALRRVAAAADPALIESEKRDAERALYLARKARDCGKALDRSAKKLFDDYAALWSVMLDLHALQAAPSGLVIEAACRRALAAHSVGSRIQLELLVPPSQRHTFAELAEKWSSNVEHFAVQRLGAPEPIKLEEEAA
jgi:hypothetical protein